MTNDLVSIITPLYNCSSYVASTIKSVISQSYTNWEMIVVDDYSNDKSKDVINSFRDDRIRYFLNTRNCGAALSRNCALRNAKGRWIAFLDSDDIWEPTKLEKQIRFMEENHYAFSYTNYCEIDEQSKILGVFVTGPKHITKFNMSNFCWPGCLTVMYDASIVGLIQIEDIKKNNDYAMWLKIIKRTDCYLLDENLAEYRKRSGSISNHSFITMIKWHFRLFHKAEGQTIFLSYINTIRNLFFGLLKKLIYVKRYEIIK